MTNASILIILDDDSDAAALAERLNDLGYAVCGTLSCGRQAIEKAAVLHPDLALIDLELSGEVEGLEVAEQLGGRTPVIYLTDGADANLLQRAQATNPFGYVLKPIDERQLHLSIQTALALYERERAHVETRNELEHQAQCLEAILESIKDGVVAIDENGKYLVFNESARRMFGTPELGLSLDQRSEAYGLFLPDRITLFPTDELPLTRAAVAGESADDVELFVRNAEVPEGLFVSLNARPIKYAGSREQGGVITCRDITKYKEQEATMEQAANEMDEQAQLMEAVVNNVNDGVVLADLTNRILFMNSPARRILGVGEDEPILDIPVSERSTTYGIFQPDRESYVPPQQLPLVNAVRGEDSDEVEFFIRNEKNAAGMHVAIRGHVLRHNPSRRVKAGMAVLRQLTKDQEAEDGSAQTAAAQHHQAQPRELPANGSHHTVRYREMETRLEQTANELRDQAQLLEAICDNIGDGIIVVDPEGQIVFANVTAERIFGAWVVDPEPGDWSSTFGIFYPDIKTHVPFERIPLVRALMGEETDEMELFICNQKNTKGTYIIAQARPIFNSDKSEITAALGTFRDLTKDREVTAQLEQTADELRDQTQLIEMIFNGIDEGIVIIDTSGRIVLSNPTAERIFGMGALDIDPDQWSKTYGIFYSDKETYVPTDQIPIMRTLKDGTETSPLELFVRNDNNRAGTYISARAYPLLSKDDQEVIASVGIILNITKRKMAEAQLEQTISELGDQTQLLETIFNSISDGVVVADQEGNFKMFNPSAEQIIGIGALEVPPDQWTESYGIFYPEIKTHVPVDQLPLSRAMVGDDIDNMELFIRNEQRPDGVYISVNGRPLIQEGGEQKGGVATFRDITESKKIQDELRKTVNELRDQNELMEATFNSIEDGIIVADANGKFLYTNPGARQILGDEIARRTGTWAEKLGNFFYLDRETPIKNEDLPLPRAIFRGESTKDEDIFIRNEERPAGFCIRVTGHPLLDMDGEIQRGVITFRDVTEQLVAEEALTQAFAQGRLEIVDTILHNIGNAINSVTIGIESVSQRLASDPLLRRLLALAKAIETHREDWLDYIQNDPQGQQVLPFIIALAEDFNEESIWLTATVNRVKDRAQHIADIVRTQKALGDYHMTRKNIELKDGLRSAVRVLQDSLNKRSIKLDIDCENAPKNIMVQESQFHQMVVNLVKNSLEAIEELSVAGGLREPPHIQIRATLRGIFSFST